MFSYLLGDKRIVVTKVGLSVIMAVMIAEDVIGFREL
jgi:hypothetical protein